MSGQVHSQAENRSKEKTLYSQFNDNTNAGLRHSPPSVQAVTETEKSMHLNSRLNSLSPRAILSACLRIALAAGLALVLSSQASAQYGGGTGTGGTGTGGGTGPGYTAPSGGYGSGKAIGIGVGAAAGGATVLFLALHHGGVTGCVRPGNDGLRLVDEKNNKSYALAPDSIALKPGEIVKVKGKKSSDQGGALSFQAKKVVKSLGSCSVDSGVAASQATPATPR
jgi:hypothetical protein